MGILTGFLGGGGAGVAAVASYAALSTGAVEGDIAKAAEDLYVYKSGYWWPLVGDPAGYAAFANATGTCLYDGPAGDDKAAYLARGATDSSAGGSVTDGTDGGNVLVFSSTGGAASLAFTPTAWPDTVIVLLEASVVTSAGASSSFGFVAQIYDGVTSHALSFSRNAVPNDVGWCSAFNVLAGQGVASLAGYTRIFAIVRRTASTIAEVRAQGQPLAGATKGDFAAGASNFLKLLVASQAGNLARVRRIAVMGVS